MLKVCKLISGVALTLGLSFGAAHAVPLAPGGVIFPTGTTSAADPDLGGPVEHDSLIHFAIEPFSPLMPVYGDVQNRVVRSAATGDLIFSPRIRDTVNIASPSPFFISGFTLDGYEGWMTDVDYRTDGLGDVGLSSASRSLSGDILTFRFDGGVQIDGLAGGVNEEGLFPSIKTDAKAFALTGSMRILGFFESDPDVVYSTTITGLAVPVSPVPVPATGLLLLTALAATRLRRT